LITQQIAKYTTGFARYTTKTDIKSFDQ